MKYFNKDSYVLLTAAVLIVGTVLIVRNAITDSAIQSDAAGRFIDALAQLVPALSRFQDSPTYTTRFGLLFAVLWTMNPAILALGFFSAYVFTPAKYKSIVIDCSFRRLPLGLYTLVLPI